MRHGCLLIVVCGCVSAPAVGGLPVQVRTATLDLEYDVNEAALPLDSVELWYTSDQGAHWQLYGPDEDRQSPVTFEPPAEGAYGLYLILRNATGPSSAAPTAGTKPQTEVFVDYTPPLVQLHEPRQTIVAGRRAVQLRWTAVDAHLVHRPIELAYRRSQDATWLPVVPEPLANTGRYDWRIPDSLVGPVSIRIGVLDRGGHRVERESRLIELPRTVSPAEFEQTGGPRPHTDPVSPDARARGSRLLTEGRKAREAGDVRRAVARMREAVKADPTQVDAFAEMAAMLYRVGDFDRALEAYQIALTQRPSMRSALHGAAMVHRQKQDFPKAAELLQTVLRYNPDDAEVWMHLGDVAVFQGDELRARECYQRATEIDPSATEIIEDARKRLDLMAELSRTYQPTNR